MHIKTKNVVKDVVKESSDRPHIILEFLQNSPTLSGKRSIFRLIVLYRLFQADKG